MIAEAHGNLLQADVDALVNTVNTVGVMGRGTGLQIRRGFPAMFKDDAAELADRPETAAHLARLLELIVGFETPYGLELLATVHWVISHGEPGDDEAVIASVRGWSRRKGPTFTADHIWTALGVLRDRGWSPALAAAH